MKHRRLSSLIYSGFILLCSWSFSLAHSKPAPTWFNTKDFSDDLWIYVPSTGAIPRYVSSMFPFFQGDEKIVRLHWNETGLQIFEEDKDRINSWQKPRWQQGSPLLTLPVEYLSGQSHHAGRTFRAKPHELTVHEYNITSHIDQEDLEEHNAPEIVRFDMDPENGSIQIELKRTYRVAESAAQEYYNGSISNLTFSVPFYYSLVKLDKATSKDYKPVRYSPYEKEIFGFFTKDHKRLDDFYGYSKGTSLSYLNRFNPQKSHIDYYLSDSLFKPENEVYLETTLDAVAQINRILQGTGVPFLRIANPDKPAHISPGDLRYSIINLIDEPLSNRLLGYGPSVVNPLTGEIIKGQVNQYSGTIQSIVPRTWNQLARLYNRNELDRNIPAKSLEERRYNTIDIDNSSVSSSGMDIDTETETESVVSDDSENTQAFDLNALVQQVEHAFDKINRTIHPPSTIDNDGRYAKHMESILAQRLRKNEQRLQHWSENNVFSEEFIWVSSTAKGKAKGIDYTKGNLYTDTSKTKLKKWHDLDDNARQHISRALVALIYRSTLVHELGHNLGLRHNFKGNSDKNNFFSPQEAREHGYEFAPASTSIMDYTPSEFDTLANFGPYDLAALRFGYKREVKYFPNNGDNPIPVNLSAMDEAYLTNKPALQYGPLYTLDLLLGSQDGTTLTLTRKDLKTYIGENIAEQLLKQPHYERTKFAFCTDYHVATNSGCERFIEGTNLYETMLFREQNYLDNYEERFPRNDREIFRTNNLLKNASYQFSTLSDMRDVIEKYVIVDKAMNNSLNADLPGGAAIELVHNLMCPFKPDSPICGLRDATHEVGHFLLDILARPDKICEVQDQDGIISQVPLTQLYEQVQDKMTGPTAFPMSCFTPWFAAQLEPLGLQPLSETRDGWALDSVSMNNPNYPSAHDLDLAGAWADKLMAMQFLAARGSVKDKDNAGGMALLDIAPINTRFKRIMETLALGKAYPEHVAFIDAQGNEVDPQTPHRWDPMRTLSPIPKSLDVLSEQFDLQHSRYPVLVKEILKQLEFFSFTRHPEMKQQAESIINLTRASDSLNPERYFMLGGKEYEIGPDNVLAWEMSKHLMVGNQEISEILETLSTPDYEVLITNTTAIMKLLQPKSGDGLRKVLAKAYVAGTASQALIRHFMERNQAGDTLAQARQTLDKVDTHQYAYQGHEVTEMQLEQLWLLGNHLMKSYAKNPDALEHQISILCSLAKLITEQRKNLSSPLLKRLWNNGHLITTIAALHDKDEPQTPSWLDIISHRMQLLPLAS